MPAPLFPANAHRYDPYRTFRFQVLIDGKAVAGLRKMSALKMTTEAVGWRSAGDPSHERRLPGGTKFDPITLEQGLTHDPVFEEWANLVNKLDDRIKLAKFRRNIVIQVLNEQGSPALAYTIRSAWVSEFQALPELDAGATNKVGIQIIKLEHEGWVRDTAVTEPTEF
jgi:phage tail-like protein